jgi:uncharacterized protein
MFNRQSTAELREQLLDNPAVAILGARQVGKTTLAKQIVAETPGALYLDLENPQDQARLADPLAYCQANANRLIVLDEVQTQPGLFSVLRGVIDRDPRPGRFILLGSASFKLLRQSQSLAGRMSIVDMSPLLIAEAANTDDALRQLWLRGGFPKAVTARSEATAWTWRDAFVRHFLDADLPALGVNVPSEVLRRFWRMLAHQQGGLFNASQLAASLAVSAPTASRYLEHLVDSLMVNKLEPYFVNVGKRLVKAPKVYVRDSGLLHYLLGIRSQDDLLSHPVAGASWEGFIIEQLQAHKPKGSQLYFYRTTAGAELDAVIDTGAERIGFEIKLSSAPKVSKGFWHACDDVGVSRAYVVAPVANGWPMAAKVEVISPFQIPSVCQINS